MKKYLIQHAGRSFQLHVKVLTRFFQILLLVLVTHENVSSQGMYIAPNSNFFVHGGSVGIFSNVSNAGNLGTKPGAVVKFMGTTWQNDSLATLPDETSFKKGESVPSSFEGKGGLFSFSQSAAIHQQTLNAGFNIQNHTGANFPNLQIDNSKGIILIGSSDAQIRNSLDFKNGKLYVDGENLQIGNNDAGTITGYSDKNYIVTGEGADGGFLYRAHVSNASGETVFPVGADDINYTPAIIVYKGSAQDFRVRPINMKFSNTDNIQTTWNIGKNSNEVAEMDVFLDNPASLETNLTEKANGNTYITHFDKTLAVWDTIKTSEIISSNLLNVHNVLHNKVLNGRRFFKSFEQNEYFSKSINGLLVMPEKLGLAENAEKIEMQSDKTYNVDLMFIVENKGLVQLNSLVVSNNLHHTFNTQAAFKVLSISATGTLHPNLHFDGLINGDTALLQSSSTLAVNQIDTIHLQINVQSLNSSNEVYYNSSYATAQSSLTGNFIKTTSVNGFNTDLAYAATPVYVSSVSAITLLNNPSKLNQFSLMSEADFKRLSWQLIDYNGRIIQTGEFRDVVKGKVNTSESMNLNPNGYVINLAGDGKLLQPLRWIKL